MTLEQMGSELCQILSKYIYIYIYIDIYPNMYIYIYISKYIYIYISFNQTDRHLLDTIATATVRLLQFLFLATWADAVEQQPSTNHKTFAVSS